MQPDGSKKTAPEMKARASVPRATPGILPCPSPGEKPRTRAPHRRTRRANNGTPARPSTSPPARELAPTRQSTSATPQKIHPPLPPPPSPDVPCPISIQQRRVERTDVGAGANEEQYHNQQALEVEDGRHGGREGWRGREEKQRIGTGRAEEGGVPARRRGRRA